MLQIIRKMKNVITVSPQKTLISVAQSLGLKTLKDMQGTTRAVYDTVPISDNMVFFEGVGSRPFPASNLNQNKFEVNSALAIQAIAFYLTSEQGDPARVNSFSGIAISNYSSFDLIIGNQTVLKNTPFSQAATAVTGQTFGCINKIWLTSPIVIPPQVSFKVVAKGASGSPSPQLTCVLYGTGVLFNAQISL